MTNVPIASGNIAQVLRLARSSLKDPSRPFTPNERRKFKILSDTTVYISHARLPHAHFSRSKVVHGHATSQCAGKDSELRDGLPPRALCFFRAYSCSRLQIETTSPMEAISHLPFKFLRVVQACEALGPSLEMRRVETVVLITANKRKAGSLGWSWAQTTPVG